MDESDYIALCKSCTLARAMMDCPRCKFKVGLPFRTAFLVEREQAKQITEHVKSLLPDIKHKLISIL